MRETFAKWYKKAWTKLFDPIWNGEDKNFETVGAKKVVGQAEKRMLPLDDVDQWLAERLRDYDHRLMEIERNCRFDRAYAWFIKHSLQNKYYRRLLQADTPTAYTKKDAAVLVARLAAI